MGFLHIMALVLKSIQQLNDFGYEFYIESYQRGYRWRDGEVKKLLKDLWYFSKNKKPNAFYCLQPIVVKLRQGKQYEVIDGQQRLTTCLILQQAFFDFSCSSNAGMYNALKQNPGAFNVTNPTPTGTASAFKINYTTRDPSDVWLSKRFDKSLMQGNIDYYHIIAAYDAVIEFLNDLRKKSVATPEAELKSTLLNDVKVIWYEPTGHDTEIDIFNRLNTGKINLNNAELIKALLLQEGNYTSNTAQNPTKEHINKRVQLASEWDRYEQELEVPSFWYFIYDIHSKVTYDTRIEYIFDLLYNKTTTDSDDYYFTFNKVADRFDYWQKKSTLVPNADNEGEKNFIAEVWDNVYDLMQTLHGWHDDRELYHLIGYLIEERTTIPRILEIQDISETRSDFVKNLNDEIKKITQSFTINDLYKGKKGLTPMLLLFNVLTENNSPNPCARFPFDSYKRCKIWDQEHVTPNKDFDPTNESHRIQFIREMLEFFSGVNYDDFYSKAEEKLSSKNPNKHLTNAAILKEADPYFCKAVIDEIKHKLRHLHVKEAWQCIRMLRLWKLSDKTKQLSSAKKDLAKADLEKETRECYKDVVAPYILDPNESLREQEEKDFIWNQVLLDYQTNRSYGNAIFPFKRQRIIDNDARHIFVPVGTKNVFLKVYSTRLSDMKRWGKLDAKSYLAIIRKTLQDYFNPALIQDTVWPDFTKK